MNAFKEGSQNFLNTKSELPLHFPQNSVESDHGCTLSIYFDNADDNVTTVPRGGGGGGEAILSNFLHT